MSAILLNVVNSDPWHIRYFVMQLLKHLIGTPCLCSSECNQSFLPSCHRDWRLICEIMIGLSPSVLKKCFDL